MVIGISLFLFRLNREPLHERLATLEAYYQQPEEIAANGRLSIWKSALDMIKDHPGTGTGWGTFRSVYPSYRRDRVFHGIAFAHNDYLQIAAGMGLPGLGLFLLFLVMLFREGFRGIQSRDRDFFSLALPGVLAGLFALSVHELVDFNLMLPANALLFFSLAGMVAGRSRELP
jgi:O-antigen ligase